jgi:hypothetical protein
MHYFMCAGTVANPTARHLEDALLIATAHKHVVYNANKAAAAADASTDTTAAASDDDDEQHISSSSSDSISTVAGLARWSQLTAQLAQLALKNSSAVQLEPEFAPATIGDCDYELYSAEGGMHAGNSGRLQLDVCDEAAFLALQVAAAGARKEGLSDTVKVCMCSTDRSSPGYAPFL